MRGANIRAVTVLYGIFASLVYMAGINVCSGKIEMIQNDEFSKISVNKNQLESYLVNLTQLDPPRSSDHLDSLNRAAAFIYDTFKHVGLEPREQEFRVSGRSEIFKNIIATIGPLDRPKFIVGAHYDVAGDQPGADDNASGVAGLLMLAELCQAHASELNVQLEFVAYTLEEPPFFRTQAMGSYIHAKSLRESKIPVVGMVSLEMLGYFSDTEKSQEYPLSIMKWFYPTQGDFIAVVGNFGSSKLVRHFKKHMQQASIGIETLRAPSFVTGVDFSDHLNYWKFDYQAIMVTDTSFFRNPNYHQTTDTLDTLDLDKMMEVIKGLVWALKNL